MLFYLRKGP